MKIKPLVNVLGHAAKNARTAAQPDLLDFFFLTPEQRTERRIQRAGGAFISSLVDAAIKAATK